MKNTKLTTGYTSLPDNRCKCNECGTELSANAFARLKHEQKMHSSGQRLGSKPAEVVVEGFIAGRIGPHTGGVMTGRVGPHSGHIQEVDPEPPEPVWRPLPCRVDWDAPRSSNIRFAPQAWYPIGQMPAPLDAGDVPKFLRIIK